MVVLARPGLAPVGLRNSIPKSGRRSASPALWVLPVLRIHLAAQPPTHGSVRHSSDYGVFGNEMTCGPQNLFACRAVDHVALCC
jgi:hypothetical protein